MLHFKYKPILSVVIRHNFYSEAVADDFGFIALPSTQMLMEAYGLKAKKSAGVSVVFQQLDGNDIPVQPLDKVIDLFFAIRVKTDLLNITEGFGQNRFWFTNLKENGSYSDVLTADAGVTVSDQLPQVCKQRTIMQFPAGAVSSVVLKKLVAPGGWTEIDKIDIIAGSDHAELNAPAPGLYLVEKHLAAGGIEAVKLLMNDELMTAGAFWSVIHLQLKPGDTEKIFSINLKPRVSVWQYYLVEPKDRFGNALVNIAALSLVYTASASSRYPNDVAMVFKSPDTHPAPVKQYIEAIKADGKVRSVYLFESSMELEVLDGEQPRVSVVYSGQEMADNIGVPLRSRVDTAIICKL